MNKRGSLLMAALWILSILALLTAGLAQRAALSLRLARFYSDRLKAYYQSYAGLQKGMQELKKDSRKSEIDTLKETWAIGSDSLAMLDEERKLDLNSSALKTLELICHKTGLDEQEAKEIAGLICIWRGDTNTNLHPDPQTLLLFKKSPFIIPEELLIILEYHYKNRESLYRQKAKEVYARLKDYVTVFNEGEHYKVNVNTASTAVLEALINNCIEELKASGTAITTEPMQLAETIVTRRQEAPFASVDLEDSLELTGSLDAELINIINALKDFITVSSQNFRIISTGNIENTRVSRFIECVFNRKNDSLLLWHQS